jgi:DNA polymerase-3 subunit gamma/tau
LQYSAIEDALALVKRYDFKLHDDCETFLRLVRYRPGLIEVNPAPGAPADMAGRIGQVLRTATGERWAVLVSDAPGAPTIAEDRRDAMDAAKQDAKTHPLVAAALTAFAIPPEAADTHISIKPLRDPDPATPEFLAEVPEDDDMDGDLLDDDDPFQEDY